MPSDLAATLARLKLSDGMPSISPHLRADVCELQRALVRWGFALIPDGKFGPSTEGALKMFQRRKGIVASGVTCPRTWEALMAAEAFLLGAGFHPVLSSSAAQAPGASPAIQAAAGGETDVVVNVPWFSQFDKEHVPSAGPTACLRACEAMMKGVGVTVAPGWGDAIRIGRSKDGTGHVTVDPQTLATARAYIDAQLVKKRPVLVGVAYSDNAKANADGLTEHWVLVYGRTKTKDGILYLYNDPGSTNPKFGSTQRFRIDTATGNLTHDADADASARGQHLSVPQKHTELTVVKRSKEP